MKSICKKILKIGVTFCDESNDGVTFRDESNDSN